HHQGSPSAPGKYRISLPHQRAKSGASSFQNLVKLRAFPPTFHLIQMSTRTSILRLPICPHQVQLRHWREEIASENWPKRILVDWPLLYPANLAVTILISPC